MSTPHWQQDQQALQQLATEVAEACPDMREMARKVAIDLLTLHGLADLEPDQVYFHQFHGASSSSKTFSGWQHHQPPFQSLTLPQLVMQRFDPEASDNADALGVYSGFYSTGPGQEAYDERSEIRLRPADALAYFWQIDFSSRFHQRLGQFWAQHADNYRTLAKASFLEKVLQLCAEQPDSPRARRALKAAQALTGVHHWPPTLGQLHEQMQPATGVRLCTFDIGGHVASDILRMRMDNGYQLLYLPGDTDPLLQFANDRELHAWVLARTLDGHARARFLSHFTLASQQEQGDSGGLRHLLEVLRSQWDAARPSGLNVLDQTLTMDAFSHLRDSCRQRMLDDAHFALRANTDLRKQQWIGYLQAYRKVFGPMAMLAWPLGLASLGAGLAELGLDIDQAIDGHTTAQRRNGVVAAIVAGIGVLFDSALLASAKVNIEDEFVLPGEAEDVKPGEDAGGQAEAGSPPEEEEEEAATAAELDLWVPPGSRPADRAGQLEQWVSNDILIDETEQPFQNIARQNGKHYAMVNGLVYEVRRVSELDTWMIIDPENPFSFSDNIPIILDAAGNWQPIERLSLKGGTPRFLLKAWGRLHPRQALPELEPTPYEVPENQRQSLKLAAQGERQRQLADPDSGSPYALYRTLRDRLDADTQAFFQTFQAPPRPALPDLPAQASPKQILQRLYQQSEGLVIGESHTQLGAKHFLLNNLGQLRKLGVKVLYLEHFMTDFQQADLDLFNRTGTLSADLKAYVEGHDFQATLGAPTPNTMKKVLHAAYNQNIRVQGIDCMASYRQAWDMLPSQTIRQQMMNYYAHRIITADQLRRGPQRWVALVGNSHANNFHGVPGLSELEGTLGLRIEDVDIGQPSWVGSDTGLWDEVLGEPLFVRNDLLLQVPITRPWM